MHFQCSNQKLIVGLWLALALLVSGSERSQLYAQTNWQDPEVASGEQILVLKNGEMLIGRIEQDAAHLIVQMRQGSRLVIAKSKAEFVCDSKSEAFWGKSARASASDVSQQIDLYRWCLKHKLFEHAESQLNIVMNCDIPPAELNSLSRQLTVMRSSHAKQQQRQLLAGLKTKQPDVADSSPLKRLPKTTQSDLVVDGMVRQTSFTAPVNQPSKIMSPQRLLPAKAKNNEGGFSKIAAIPDLQQSHRLDHVAPVTADPYDASAFNAETARRNSPK